MIDSRQLEQLMSTRARSEYRYQITIGGPKDIRHIADMDLWCSKNCKGKWKVNSVFLCYYQFEEEQDAVMFTLKWK